MKYTVRPIEQSGFNLAYVVMQMQASVAEKRLRLEEVAALKCCSVSTVLAWIRAKKVNAVKCFGIWKVYQDEKLAACSVKKQQAETALQDEIARLQREIALRDKRIAELERELGMQEAQHRIENECPTCKLEHAGICEE